MRKDVLFRRIKNALTNAFGERLQGVLLYGSEARGKGRTDSDIDFLVLLDSPPNEPDDSWACIDALYPLVLDSGLPIHAEPVDIAEYKAAEFPLYQRVLKEGILL